LGSKLISSSFLVFVLLLSIISYPISNSPTIFIDAFAETFQLEKDGGEYVTLETDLPEELEELTLAAWVTPDYNEGSSVMTILGQHNGFFLGINRNLDPQEHAIFGVYDGMEWNYVTSNSKIKAERTHIAATFDDATIKIYINGEHEGTLSYIDTMQLNQRGLIEEVPLTSLSSDYEINVGAYTKIKKNNVKVSQEFSGLIHLVELYGKALDDSEIKNLYQSSFDVQEFSAGQNIIAESVETDREQVQEFSAGQNIISESVETDREQVQEFSAGQNIIAESVETDREQVQDFKDGTVIISSSTTSSNGSTSNDIENPSLDEIYKNLLRISIKYNNLYGNDDQQLTLSRTSTTNSNSPYNYNDYDQDSSSLDEIQANLLRISIKYNNLYENDGPELTSSEPTPSHASTSIDIENDQESNDRLVLTSSEPTPSHTSTSNDIENDQENSSLDEIQANLLRISLKYNELYTNYA